MIRHQRVLFEIIVGLALAASIGCTRSGEEDPAAPGTTGGGETATPFMAIVDYSYMDLTDPQNLADVARADLYVTETGYLWSTTVNQNVVADLKAINPDIKVLGYINAHGSWLAWGDSTTNARTVNPYGWDWFHATKPYWSSTTTGDTMMSWPGKIVINLLDPGCRAAMVDVLVDHFHRHSNVLDGFYWDHFGTHLWTLTGIDGLDGQLDLDGDGIYHRDDADELAAYLEASSALVRELRAAMGERVIQVANGGRALLDSTFAGLVDGMLYENFPEVGFWGENMRMALDPDAYNNLFTARNWPRTRNGGPYLILSNKDRMGVRTEDGDYVAYRYAEFARVVALMTGTMVSYHEGANMHYGWPDVDLDLGAPLGGVVRDGDLLVRDFERGQVTLNLEDGGDLPLPFSFEITEKGLLKQSFAFPSIYP